MPSSRKRKRTTEKTSNQEKELESTTVELIQEANEYLENWEKKNEDPTFPWKFKKSKQVWLLRWMYRPDIISKSMFAILIKYLDGLKGHARERVLQDAQMVVNQAPPEKKEEEQDLAIKLERRKFKRALRIAAQLS